MSAALDRSEAGRLAACEARIERGLATFVDVGQALLEVRDGRLYRAEHGTFEGYCRERWGMSRQRAGQLIDASEVVGVMTTIVDTPAPRNEAVARELAPLRTDPPRLREAWTAAVEEHGPEPTAAQVRGKVRDPIGDAIKRIPQGDSRVYAIDTAAFILRDIPPPEELYIPRGIGHYESLDAALRFLTDWVARMNVVWDSVKEDVNAAP